jgi:hypothetical protein
MLGISSLNPNPSANTLSPPTKETTTLSAGDQLHDQAAKLIDNGATRLGIQIYKQAIAAYDVSNLSKIADCWHHIGHAYESMGEYSKAVEAMDKSIKIYESFSDKKHLDALKVDRDWIMKHHPGTPEHTLQNHDGHSHPWLPSQPPKTSANLQTRK